MEEIREIDRDRLAGQYGLDINDPQRRICCGGC
jgi:hypothetical protein